jgi:uncharacterized membrane protein
MLTTMKKFYLLFALLTAGAAVRACPFCNPRVREGIYDSMFFPNVLIMLSAFVALGLLVIGLSKASSRRYAFIAEMHPRVYLKSPVPVTTAATILGIGVGGFIDGIVLHQILQVHEMLSNKVPSTDYVGKSVNMFWDGIFHLFCLIVVLVGVARLWRAAQQQNLDRSGWLVFAGLLGGWGLFNVVEGVIDHHLLKLHNVIERAADHAPANLLFLGISVLMILIAGAIINRRLPMWHGAWTAGRAQEL